MKQSYDFTAGPIGRPLLLYTLPCCWPMCCSPFISLWTFWWWAESSERPDWPPSAAPPRYAFYHIPGHGPDHRGAWSASPSRPAPRTPPAWRKTAGTLFSASLVVSLLVAVAGALTAPCLLQLLSVPSEAMTDASAYLRVLCLGTPSPSVTWPTLPSAKGTGTPKSPFSAAAAAINLLLDLLLVGILALGTVGAAYATVASQEPPFCCPSPWAEGRMGRFPAAPASRSAASPWPPLSKLACPRPFKWWW